MIFSATGSEIPKLFVEVFEKTFDMSFEGYLAGESRGYIALVVSGENRHGLLAAQCGLDERSATTLASDAMKLARLDSVGAYFTPSRFQIAPLKHDVLLVQQRWLNLDIKRRTGIAYHEACHCFRESKCFQPLSESSAAYLGGKHYRKFTRYHDDVAMGHDDQWFALLVDKAQTMQSKFQALFSGPHEVIESGLSADLFLSEGESLSEWKAEVDAR